MKYITLLLLVFLFGCQPFGIDEYKNFKKRCDEINGTMVQIERIEIGRYNSYPRIEWRCKSPDGFLLTM